MLLFASATWYGWWIKASTARSEGFGAPL